MSLSFFCRVSLSEWISGKHSWDLCVQAMKYAFPISMWKDTRNCIADAAETLHYHDVTTKNNYGSGGFFSIWGHSRERRHIVQILMPLRVKSNLVNICLLWSPVWSLCSSNSGYLLLLWKCETHRQRLLAQRDNKIWRVKCVIVYWIFLIFLFGGGRPQFTTAVYLIKLWSLYLFTTLDLKNSLPSSHRL